MSAQKILIVGAGIGGLGAATALGNAGHEVDVVEISPEPDVHGVGINQPGNSLRALRMLGVLDEILEAGFQFSSWLFHDQDGNLVVEVPSGLGGDGIPANTGLARPALHAILIGAAERAAARIRYGTTIDELDEVGGHARFTDGTSGDYDLIVAFDGINSQMRRRLFGEATDPVYTGFAGWRVMLPRPQELDRGALYQAVGAKGGHIPLSADTMYLLLVTPEPHHARYDKSALAGMLRERLAPFGGPLARMRDELPDDADVVYAPLKEVLLPTPWFKGRTVVCGDAAHACTPHLTQGAAMALEDAVVLAEELAEPRNLQETLLAFGERRFRRAKLVQDASRGILDAEMSINHENIGGALQHMRENLPGQTAAIDEILNRPA